MATPVRRWLALTGASLVIVAAWTLPPSRVDFQRRRNLPEVERFNELDAEIRRDVGILQAIRWSDSLSELTVRTAVDGLAFGAFAVDAETAETLSRRADVLRDVVGSLEPRDRSLVVGVFYQPVGLGRPVDVPGPAIAGVSTYVGTRDGTAYCLQVDPVPVTLTARDVAFDTERLAREGIGACRLFAEHGLPGAQVRRWLDGGAVRFAVATRPPTGTLGLGDRSGRATGPLDPGVLFGMWRPSVVDRNPTVGRCLAGDDGPCLRLVTAREEMDRVDPSDFTYIAARSPLMHTDRAGGGYSFGRSERYLLADLEAEFGREAFARFWASDLQVPDAFEEAFGVSLGSWIRAWAQSEVGVYYAGPRLRPGTGLWSLLALGLLASAACLVGMRRKVA